MIVSVLQNWFQKETNNRKMEYHILTDVSFMTPKNPVNSTSCVDSAIFCLSITNAPIPA